MTLQDRKHPKRTLREKRAASSRLNSEAAGESRMGSPSKAELLAELEALRSRVAALEQYQRGLTAVVHASRAITSSLETEKSLQAIVWHAATIEDDATVWLFVLEPEAPLLRCRAATRFTPGEMASLTLPVGQGLSGQVALTRQAVAVPDMRQDLRMHARPDLVEKYGLLSYLGTPIVFGDRLLGVLAISSFQPRTYSSDDVALFSMFATQAAIVIENARLHEAAVRRGEELGALLRAARTVTAGLDLQTTLEQIATEASRIAHCQHVKLLLVDKEAQLLRIGVLHETPPPDGFPLPVGAGLSGTVAKTGQPLYIADTQNDPRSLLAAFDRKVGFRTYLGLPVKIRDEVLGVLTLNTAEPREYPPDEIALLTSFADQAAVAIENARLYTASEERAAELATLQEVGQAITRRLELPAVLDAIVAGAIELLGSQFAQIVLWDEAAQRLQLGAAAGPEAERVRAQRFELGRGINGVVAQTREPMILADYQASPYALPEFFDVVSTVTVPIQFGDRFLGVLHSHTTQPGRQYTPTHLRRLQMLATQAAIAIENARLHQGAVRRGGELEAILEASRAIQSSLDLGQTLRVIIDQAMAISGASAVRLFLLDEDEQLLRCHMGAGLPADQQDVVIRVGESFSGQVAATRAPVGVADCREDSRLRFPEHAFKHNLISYLGLPVTFRDRLVGVIVFNTPAPRVYSPSEVALLSLFASQAAAAIENARLYETTRRELAERTQAEAAVLARTRQLEAVRAISEEITRELDLRTLLDLIVRRAVELAEASSGMVRFWDEASQLLVPQSWISEEKDPASFVLRLDEGVAGTAARRREGLIVNDFRTSPYATPRLIEGRRLTAVLAQPLLYRDRLLGVLALDREDPARPFTRQDGETLALLAGQAAVAIENARLLGAAVRRGEEMEALLRATRTLMSEVDLQQILDRIVTEAAAITGCLHVKLLLVDRANAVLRVGALRGTTLPEGFQIPLGAGLSGKVAATGEPLFVVDPSESPDNILAAKDTQTGVVTYLGLPIKSGDRMLGVLTFNTTDPHRYSAEELAYLASFADYAAIAIEKARLFQELNESYAYLQVAQDELIRTEKLRALGQMSAGIAHDLNNTLAAILGQVELLGLRTRDPEVQETLRILEMAATDGAQVVRRLQDFARQRERSPLAPIDLAQVVTEALEITRARWRDELQRHGRVIDIRLQLVGIPPILGYAPEVREVLTNLILNAVDAMPQGGALSFTAWETGGGLSGDQAIGQLGNGSETDFHSALPDRPVAELPSCPAAAWVELLVADTGIGMSEDVRKRIFDPFFTTKGGRGTGMGLSVVYGIMERHGGHVVVRSTRGQGTTVALRFQKAQERLAAEGPTQQGALVTAPRRLLVVDDDPTVRTTLASMLRAVGHLVTEAEGGAAGIGLLGKVSVDLVLTDLGMPDVTGWDVARAVKLQTPKVPVVLLTGWGEQGAGEPSAAKLVNRMLGKPVRLQDLLAVIEELTKRAE